VVAKIPPHLKRVSTLPREISMPENKRQFETGTAARYLRYCGIFNENLLQIYCSLCL